jgi:hypothetical protein
MTIRDIAQVYLLLLVFVGLPASLYSLSAIRHERAYCARLARNGRCRQTVVDQERNGPSLVALLAFDLEHIARRDLLFIALGERFFASDRTRLCRRLHGQADRAAVPFFLVECLESNVVVSPGNDRARRLVPSTTNMPRTRLIAMVNDLYRQRGLQPPAAAGHIGGTLAGSSKGQETAAVDAMGDTV